MLTLFSASSSASTRPGAQLHGGEGHAVVGQQETPYQQQWSGMGAGFSSAMHIPEVNGVDALNATRSDKAAGQWRSWGHPLELVHCDAPPVLL